jgi:hypothetical protein
VSPEQVLQFVMSGITAGSIYGLVALGVTLVFNATGIINFAQRPGRRRSSRRSQGPRLAPIAAGVV